MIEVFQNLFTGAIDRGYTEKSSRAVQKAKGGSQLLEIIMKSLYERPVVGEDQAKMPHAKVTAQAVLLFYVLCQNRRKLLKESLAFFHSIPVNNKPKLLHIDVYYAPVFAESGQFFLRKTEEFHSAGLNKIQISHIGSFLMSGFSIILPQNLLIDQHKKYYNNMALWFIVYR